MPRGPPADGFCPGREVHRLDAAPRRHLAEAAAGEGGLRAAGGGAGVSGAGGRGRGGTQGVSPERGWGPWSCRPVPSCPQAPRARLPGAVGAGFCLEVSSLFPGARAIPIPSPSPHKPCPAGTYPPTAPGPPCGSRPSSLRYPVTPGGPPVSTGARSSAALARAGGGCPPGRAGHGGCSAAGGFAAALLGVSDGVLGAVTGCLAP